MELLDKYNIKPMTILKIAGLALVVLILLSFSIKLIGSTFSQSLGNGFRDELSLNSKDYDMDLSYGASTQSFKGNDGVSLSSRNIAPSMPINKQVNTGDLSENFEVTEYNGTIETRDLKNTCKVITDLKPKDYVIFENSNEGDTSCNFSFKVKKDKQDEILGLIKDLKPKDLIENTQTIKKLVDDFTSEMEILNKKKISIESTLEDAIKSYDEISRVATQARDAQSLANIIDSKIRIIEKLSQERINVNEQLDRLGRQKAEQLDRLEYTYFYLYIYENKFMDAEMIKDSWKNEIKNFVSEINSVAQDSSIGLVALIFKIIQLSLYLLVITITLKLGWKIAKIIWKK
jgi:hypothetical protein